VFSLTATEICVDVLVEIGVLDGNGALMMIGDDDVPEPVAWRNGSEDCRDDNSRWNDIADEFQQNVVK
jgi:hypothetical protein